MYSRSITEFGAVGDGVTKCTAALQQAIDDCASKGGGNVIIEDGEFVTGTIFLKDNVRLELRPTGKLLAGLNPEDYPDFDPCFDKSFAPRNTARCLIYAENCRNIGIFGGGTIDCRGEHFCEYSGYNRFWRRKTDKLPARMIFFYQCCDSKIEDISVLEMAGGWAFWLNGCDRIRLTGLTVRCNPVYPNSDGVHINCSRDIILSDSILDCGDDCVILRANTKTLPKKRPCERITVTNCTLSSRSCAIRIGWTNDGVIKNSVFSNLSVTDSWYGISIEFPKKSEAPFTDQGDDSTEVKQLSFDNIVMDSIDTSPINILAYPYNKVKSISDISFRGIISTSKELPIFRVENGVRVERISLSDCSFRTLGESGSLVFTNISGVSMNNVSIGNQS